MTATDVKSALQTLASPEKAKSSAWFFKTAEGEYGAGDQFLGVTVPEQRKVARQFKDLPLDEVERLLQSPIHEHRLTALLVLVGQYQRAVKSLRSRRSSFTSEESRRQRATSQVFPERLTSRKAIVELYLRNLDWVNNWDLVDSSAPQILGEWLLSCSSRSRPRAATDIKHPGMHGSLIRSGSPQATLPVEDDKTIIHGSGMTLEQLAKSENLWYRRIAMISCQALIRAGEFSDALRIAELLVHPTSPLASKGQALLIQKAVGWMLREIGDRDHAVERRFLDRHVATMPRTMLHYAIEKFPPAERRNYLSRKGSA